MRDLNKVSIDWKRIACSLFAFICIAFTAYCFEYKVFNYAVKFSMKHILIYLLIFVFVLMCVWIGWKKVFNFLHQFRYPIGILIFVLCVIFQINTSSAGAYNGMIQPGFTTKFSQPVWGVLREVRTDEFIGATPALLSQAIDGTFTSWNNRIMATNSCLLMQPKVACWDISILASPNLVGFLFLDPVRGFCFHSMFLYLLSFFATYEFLLLFTNNRKFISCVGACLMCFSPLVLWWNCQQYLCYGFICLLFFNKLLHENKIIFKVIWSLLIGWGFACFVMLLYPAWMVPYGYLYLIFLAWIIFKCRTSLRVRNFLYLGISVLVVCVLVLPAIIQSSETISAMTNSVYPGARNEVGGYGWEILFNWLPSIFYGLSNASPADGNVCECSQYLSFFPFPLLVGIIVSIYNIKNHKNDLILLLLTVYGVLLTVWSFVPIGFLAKISFLYMSMATRTTAVVGLICIFILIRLIVTNFGELLTTCTGKIIIAACGFVTLFLTLLVCTNCFSVNNGYSFLQYFALLAVCACVFIFIIFSKTKRNIGLTILLIVSVFCFSSVQPISIGLNSLYSKPVSQEIQRLNKENNSEVWASVDSNIYYWSNFVLANGPRVINSLNFYPNNELWHKVDPDCNYEDIYNRYAHVAINLTTQQTSFSLIHEDSIRLDLNINDIKTLDINKLTSENPNLSELSNDSVHITQIYGEDGAYIYQVN